MRGRRSEGYTLIELLIVVAIIGLIAAIAVPVYGRMLTRSRIMAVAADLRTLHTSFMRYYADHGQFPSEDDFDLTTLSPLSSGGYFRNVDGLNQKLQNDKILVYRSFDRNGPASEFLVVARPKNVRNVWAYAVRYQLVGGQFIDGVYLWQNGRLVKPDGFQ